MTELKRLVLAPVSTRLSIDSGFVMFLRKRIDKTRVLKLRDRLTFSIVGSHVEFVVTEIFPEEGVFGERTLFNVLSDPKGEVVFLLPNEKRLLAHCLWTMTDDLSELPDTAGKYITLPEIESLHVKLRKD